MKTFPFRGWALSSTLIPFLLGTATPSRVQRVFFAPSRSYSMGQSTLYTFFWMTSKLAPPA